MALNIGAYDYGNAYNGMAGYGMTGAGTAEAGATGTGATGAVDAANPDGDNKVHPGRKSSPAECETCRERKYQDGSDEGNVSFKTAQHVSPEAAAGAVRAHEGQHVSNAYKKAAMNNGKVLQASVSIKMAICPECGRSYVAGGLTRSTIKYSNEDNPYTKNLKSRDKGLLSGMNINTAV